MAASNESQGLKIAVAVFVMLTVVLAVSTYFSYRAYTESDAKLVKAESDVSNAKKAQSELLTSYEGLRKEIGAKNEGFPEVQAEIKAQAKKLDEELNKMVAAVNDSVTKAQGAGAQGPELEDAKTKVQTVVASYRSEPNKTFLSALDRMAELLQNLSMLQTQVALNYVDVKRNLESTNSVNAQKLDVVAKAEAGAKQDLEAEQKKHVEERQTILTKIDQYTTENAKLQTEVANLNARIRKTEEDYTKSLSLSQQVVREQRDRLERKETVLDRPDGRVTFVDYSRKEIHANLTKATGARPQMKFAIFDSNSPGLPTDRPKGVIQLTQVGDRYSVGQIERTVNSIDPIRVGDYVYSSAWSPGEPMRFALVGKIDINRDGVDDRAELKRLIESAGGTVDYDLPPPDAGKESGKLSGRLAWYVVDERMPLREVYTKKTNVTANENAEFLKKQSEAVRELRANGVRPMLIERLLAYLGYDFMSPVTGRAEAIDVQAQKRLVAPRQNLNRAPATPAEPGGAAEPKDEPK